MVLSLLACGNVLIDERARFTPPADDDHRYEGIAFLCGGMKRLQHMIAADRAFKASRRFNGALTTTQHRAVVRRRRRSKGYVSETLEKRKPAAIP
jgi:hypothetical protein